MARDSIRTRICRSKDQICSDELNFGQESFCRSQFRRSSIVMYQCSFKLLQVLFTLVVN